MTFKFRKSAMCTCLMIISINVSASTVLPIEWEVMELINQERTANGMGQLVMDSHLFEAARFHSEDMYSNGILQNDSSDGTSWSDRIVSFGYSAGPMGEMIAAGYLSASEVVDAWVGSTPHHQLMLLPNIQAIGVGLDHNYWTVDFGSSVVDPVVPIPAAVWLFGSGLVCLIGIARRKIS